MENKIPKACFLIPSVKSGGIETYLLRFLKHNPDFTDVTILVRNFHQGELMDEFKNTGAKIVFQPLGYFNFLNIIKYYKFFRDNQFHVVCDFNANFAGIPMLLCKIAGIKKRIVFYRQSSHHFTQTYFKVIYSNLLNRLVYNYSTDIFSNSRAAFEFFFQNKFEKDPRFQIIRNGVNFEDFSGFNKQHKDELRKELGFPLTKFIIGHVGRFAKAKNHHFIIETAEELLKFDDNFFFVLVGNETEKLLPIINKKNLSKHFFISGYRSDIPNVLRCFDLFFFPSTTEGQPNALIEAMVIGIPIVASNINPIIECLPNNQLQCLISPTDVSAARDKIIQVQQETCDCNFQEFARNNFNAESQFKKFRDSLY
jgi:glycosyltransferase involved in cell wall biosynthesis